ncbi:bifunctional dTDP-4-dehydrorhamnose 3,5-epimerase family protein/NAD(P)-dependent oxidoreductase [Paenarthrobacter aurescens]|uniref:dTDP-4-dehydrorhamnose reductase n=1 Tax=Paenarthrobacter aurescens TaxID=43663 RepID=A0A4Y3NKM0_PAEAU|nr:bifunctional dTDP-4-dehydrorhamnose 3,5-epimerase family protein/NAD(P)-dependent oxidoreductase [Paenarthrobacter aurescens]MDO6143610.1 bifunctional dTDP-4-dehydrorhamnose 3,5-epimerase family protein/NAD(P)-dependent oxidoreductase [Paenarthrobacter aurescens]MDO6147458.1 bifunctional dTDP-4-dehydrorhamnose 3,5-epimerase family protein/NAD(P)-dependent oxidoreductase [Paenarthrobacter aurescens]MDO6158702.1 bifunctional dTDP-4-dehydrorhamnose 3,5-epimerase family protein/NAD(P)-dependent o
MEPGRPLRLRTTTIAGLLLLDLPVHGDERGWFKENWHRAKMLAAGLPDFGPVQNNISFNAARGTVRGIHAEPWDKFISLSSGRIFGAWVDLREGPAFGTLFTAELTPGEAVFVPRGVGNAFQTLDDDTAYTYLVNDHWSVESQKNYTFLNLADESVAVPWPIPLESSVISAPDRKHPRLKDVVPMSGKRTLVLGADGQLGSALRKAFAGDSTVHFLGREQFDITLEDSYRAVTWGDYATIINAAAFTAVDAAETPEGRAAAWSINATAVSRLARAAVEHSLTLVHVSSDYVFDGTAEVHVEDEVPTPLGVYGQSKAAGDAAVAAVPKHYIVRTSWVVGEGRNFVRTMASLAAKGASPSVVDDQWGRLSFAQDIAAGIRHLLESKALYGTYNLSSGGTPQSWHEVACDVYRLLGTDPSLVRPVSTTEYAQPNTAPRPRSSVLDLSRIRASGFDPPPATLGMARYLKGLEL